MASLFRILTLCLATAVALSGCDDSPMMEDAGDGPDDAGQRRDSGPRPDAGGFDAGAGDAGAPDDGGPPDAGPGQEQSRVTVVLAPTPLTLDVVDTAGAPLVLDAAHAFDHDATPGETFFASAGTDRLELGPVSGGTIGFVNPVTWVDGAGAMLMPDLLFAGSFGGGGNEILIGTFGSDARVYDFTAAQFGGSAGLTESPGGGAFTPISATFVNLGTGSASVVALKAGSPLLHILTGTQFAPFNTAPVTCSSSTPINANLIVGAELAGATPPGGADSVILIEGSDAFVLESLSPVCFSDAFALTDGAGAPVTPEIAFGIDYDGNSTDDLILIDRVIR